MPENSLSVFSKLTLDCLSPNENLIGIEQKGGPVGAGAFFLLSWCSAERPPRNSILSTQERASSTKRIGSRVSLSFLAQVSLIFWSRSIEKLFERISRLDREAGPRFIPKTTDSSSDFSRAAINSFFPAGAGLGTAGGGGNVFSLEGLSEGAASGDVPPASKHCSFLVTGLPPPRRSDLQVHLHLQKILLG